jgi:hypothetical protein
MEPQTFTLIDLVSSDPFESPDDSPAAEPAHMTL